VIELENVAYNYGGGELFSDLSLKLSAGSFHFLTGPSGSGKTTFMKLCYGALMPTLGQVRVFGEDLREFDRDQMAMMRRRVGVVHQDCRFLDHLPVADNIALPMTVAGRDPSQESGPRRCFATGTLRRRASTRRPCPCGYHVTRRDFGG
jgi:cell division transport system ATP-binding protein